MWHQIDETSPLYGNLELLKQIYVSLTVHDSVYNQEVRLKHEYGPATWRMGKQFAEMISALDKERNCCVVDHTMMDVLLQPVLEPEPTMIEKSVTNAGTDVAGGDAAQEKSMSESSKSLRWQLDSGLPLARSATGPLGRSCFSQRASRAISAQIDDGILRAIEPFDA